MLLLVSFLAYVASGIDHVECADYSCNAKTYEYEGTTYQVKCIEDPTNFFYKGKGEIDDYQLEQFCQARGFDGAGRAWVSLPPKLGQSAAADLGDEINTCNVGYEKWNLLNDYKGAYFWPVTWECVDYEDAPADCCTNWTGACYSRRNEKNKFHACFMCGPSHGPCNDACGGGDTLGAPGDKEGSEECRECCQAQKHETPWRCNEEPGPMTEDEAKAACSASNENKKKCKKAVTEDVGKCKFKKNKHGSNMCKLKAYYGAPCDTLTRKACKKMVKKGICESNDNYKTCMDPDE